MRAELIEGMKEEQYHAETGLGDGQYITRSMIGCVIKDPPLFKYRYIDRMPFVQIEENDGMRFGQYIEDYLLGGDMSRWARKPATCFNKRGEEKEWHAGAGRFVDHELTCPTAQWMKDHEYIIDDDEHALAEFLQMRFEETALGQFWLKHAGNGQTQIVCRWMDEQTGLRCQTRLDHVIPGKLLVDLKSTRSPLETFSGVAYKRDYHLQHSMYQLGYELCASEKLPFVFAVGETGKDTLQRARILSLHGRLIDEGFKTFRRGLDLIKDGEYTAYDALDTEPRETDLPAYLHYQLEDEA